MRASRFTVGGIALAYAVALLGSVSLEPSPARADDGSFTFVVLPDTQGYTTSDELAPTIAAQTDWVVEHRDDLNIAFTAQLGDLVESWPSVPMWERVDAGLSRLDAAGVPYSVLPGNHDMDLSNGTTPTFDQYFPPSRFATASWNSDEVRYGGYLGDNQFGADAVDRGNKDNFALFSAGGLDWLVLNLEFEAPSYSLAWAQRVLDAHPDRRVILATHGFVATDGNRNDAIVRHDGVSRTANQIWRQLIARNCNIFLVVNGHWRDGELSEARRTDVNDCGKPVHQILTNYQDRALGGDGWLRYYTFTPSADTITAHTYSPTRGEFEIDASSTFTLDYDMTPQADVAEEVLVPGSSTWAYRHSRDPWPTGWDAGGFDGSSWSRAKAPLGFGTRMIETNIDAPAPTSNRARGIIFRRTFDVERPEQLRRVRIFTKADDGVVVRLNGVEVGRANVAATTPTVDTYATSAVRSGAAVVREFAVPESLLRPTGNVLAVSLHLNYTGTPDAHFDLVMAADRVPSAAVQQTLISQGDVWRYRYETGAWPQGFAAPNFDETTWSQGPAPLGFGTPVSTNIDVPGAPSARPLAALFRRSFTLTRASDVTSLRIRTRADDGLALWLNGTELTRVRLPATTLGSGTYATAVVSTATALANPVEYDVPIGLLRDGLNVLTASAHVNYRGTANLSFDAEAIATVVPSTPPTEVAVEPLPAGSNWRYQLGYTWPSDWQATSFDDASWTAGPAPLGFGVPVSTIVDSPAGTTRPRSLLFRSEFTVDDVNALTSLSFDSVADDGLVVWVNGVEIGRSNAPAGSLGAGSYATAAPRHAGAPPVSYDIPISLLNNGRNVVSAALLLNYRGTPDAVLEGRIHGVAQVTNP